ncbi:uncharacterized protein K441DRAFT_606998 [Cenococcum geophilum 1.58]|uniref:uncharacterized protein n=1 Tax=Cenococcum geophilum 1.58 TaxID=794803 RepID=UPI00358ED848|nr:hypothetical protein K441DRAFT_606998 [Cenococcum geophilum 1.58]
MEANLHLSSRQLHSSHSLSAIVNVITWFLLVASGLAILTRLLTKRALERRIDIDDALAVAALIFSIGSGLAVTVQTANGLGKEIHSLGKTQIIAYEKSQYATKFLYVATLASAKLSIISLMVMLTASELHRMVGILLGSFIAIWAFSSEFAVAFQCGIPRTWDSLGDAANCYDSTSFWRATGIINILTDLALVLFPVHVIVMLQMERSKKLGIIALFAARSLDIVATAVQLGYTEDFQSSDPTLDLWKWTLMTQVIQCITIITSCVPYLRSLLEHVPSGMYSADELRRKGMTTAGVLGRKKSGSEWYKLSSSTSKTSQSQRFIPTVGSTISGLPDGPKRPDGETTVEISSPRETNVKKNGQVSDNGGLAKIIKTTTMSAAWDVDANKSDTS